MAEAPGNTAGAIASVSPSFRLLLGICCLPQPMLLPSYEPCQQAPAEHQGSGTGCLEQISSRLGRKQQRQQQQQELALINNLPKRPSHQAHVHKTAR